MFDPTFMRFLEQKMSFPRKQLRLATDPSKVSCKVQANLNRNFDFLRFLFLFFRTQFACAIQHFQNEMNINFQIIGLCCFVFLFLLETFVCHVSLEFIQRLTRTFFFNYVRTLWNPQIKKLWKSNAIDARSHGKGHTRW